MKRIMVAVGALLLGAGAVMAQQEVAVQQQNLMKAQGRSMYGVLLKMVKGETPYDQAARRCRARRQLDADVTKIPAVFAPNTEGRDVVDATLRVRRRRSGQSKADFDAQGAASFIKAIDRRQGHEIKDARPA